MRASTKLILTAWVVLLVLVGGIIYGAYSKLKPEVLISLLQSQVVKNYPGTEMKIESYEYGFALDFDLDIHGLNLIRNGRKILMAENLQLKVPWWLILLNRGSAQINISGLTVFLASEIEASNKSNGTNTKAASKKIELTLPDYLLDAQYTLRAKDISIRDIQENREILAFSKLLVREFQINKNSAFEMNIPIRISHKSRNFNSDLWLFGDLTPSPSDWKRRGSKI
jgi:hypothetical protein